MTNIPDETLAKMRAALEEANNASSMLLGSHHQLMDGYKDDSPICKDAGKARKRMNNAQNTCARAITALDAAMQRSNWGQSYLGDTEHVIPDTQTPKAGKMRSAEEWLEEENGGSIFDTDNVKPEVILRGIERIQADALSATQPTETGKSEWAPERVWLLRGMGDGGGHVWCDDPHPNAGDEPESAEYVLAPPAPRNGWQLVPKEPTEEMLDELGDDGYNSETVILRYKAMLACAPDGEGAGS